MTDLEQEIEWLKEEIEMDECVMGTSDASGYHRSRIAENKAKLKELEDLLPLSTSLNKED